MKRPVSLKRIAVKMLLWTVGTLALLLLLVQILLSPTVLTPVIDRFADYWIECDVSFGKVGLNMFRTFPNITLTVEDCQMKYDAEKFSIYTRAAGCGRASRAGSYLGQFRVQEECDTVNLSGRYDTLAVMSSLRLTVNPFALIHNKLRIKQIAVTDLKGYAHRFDTSAVNWDIFKTSESASRKEKHKESSDFEMPVPVIGRITLDGNPRVVFTDCISDASLLVTFKSFDFKGNRSSGKELIQSFRLKLDSVLVANHHSGSTEAVSLDKLRLHSTGDYGLEGSITASLIHSDTSHGRIKFPVDMFLNVDVPPDSVMKVDVNDISGEICSLPFSITGSIAFPKDSIRLNAVFDIREGRLGEVIGEYGSVFSGFLTRIQTDALFNLHAEVDGDYVKTTRALPDFRLKASVPESVIRYGDEHLADFSLMCSASGVDGKVKAVLDTFLLTSPGGTRLSADGSVDDLLGENPLFDLNAAAEADLSWWSDKLGSDSTFRFSGDLSADVKGRIKLSQMNLQQFSNADAGAAISCRNVNFSLPSDSINVFADSLSVSVGAVRNKEFEDIPRGTRVMVSSICVDTAFVSIGSSMEVTLKDVICSGHSDAAIMTEVSVDSISFHPYYLQMAAGRLSLLDSDSTRITFRNTDNILKLSYQNDNDTIPAIDLSSKTGMIGLRTKGVLAGIRSFNMRFNAVKGGVPVRQGKITRKTGTALQDTLSTLSESDLHFSMGESFKKLYQQWSARGSLSFKSSIIRSPRFPLRTSISDMQLRFSSNMLNLNSFKIKAGDSELNLHGKISGVKRAVLGNGIVKAELTVDSRRMDVNELLAALAVGAKDTTHTILPEEDAMTTTFVESEDVDVEQKAENMSSPLLMIPGNLDAVCRLCGHTISISNMVVDSLNTVVEMRHRCLRISDITAMTNMGTLSFEGFYATPSRDDVSIGMDLELSGVTASDVIDMIPGIDSLMPMLSSFQGRLKCQVAGASHLDTNMRLILPTTMGVLRIGGDSLHLDQTPTSRKITKLLMFKDKKAFNINTMSVDAQIHDNQLEVFPFILNIDRYKLAASGRMGLDGSCSYHVSIMKSPLPFKLGLDVYGEDYDHLRFKMVKPKYRDEEKVPAFSVTVDQTRAMLSQMISDIFTKGVDRLMSDQELLKAVEEKKKSISYRPAIDQKSEAISRQEIDRMQKESQGAVNLHYSY